MPTCQSCGLTDNTVTHHRHLGAYKDVYLGFECAWCSGADETGCPQCIDADEEIEAMAEQD